MTSDNDKIGEAIAVEVRRLHEVLEAWFTGNMDKSEFHAAIADVLHPEFAWVSPSGKDVSRDQMIDGLHSGYASNPDFSISVNDIRLVARDGDLAVASYTEHQTGARNAPPVNVRRSTVVFVIGPRLLWRYLHETYRE